MENDLPLQYYPAYRKALRDLKAAIEQVAEMETHNSVTKEELVSALRWLFRHYDFEGG